MYWTPTFVVCAVLLRLEAYLLLGNSKLTMYCGLQGWKVELADVDSSWSFVRSQILPCFHFKWYVLHGFGSAKPITTRKQLLEYHSPYSSKYKVQYKYLPVYAVVLLCHTTYNVCSWRWWHVSEVLKISRMHNREGFFWPSPPKPIDLRVGFVWVQDFMVVPVWDHKSS